MSTVSREDLIIAFRSRGASHSLRVGLAIVIAALFFPLTGGAFAILWAITYVAIQLLEKRLYREANLLTRLSTARGRLVAIAFVMLNNAIFAAFGVGEVVLGGTWGAVSGALLLCGALLNAVMVSAASPILFRAWMAPATLSLLFLPAAAIAAGQNLLLGALTCVAAVLFVYAAHSVHRIFNATLRQLKEAQEAAEAANKAKSEFLATISHEIRTPMNGVLGMAQAMAADPLSPTQRQRLVVLQQSGEMLMALLNDVLDLSKIEAGRLEIESVPFDFGDVARGARATYASQAEAKGLKLTLDMGNAQGVYLGDPTRIRQVMFNLVSNALKFTEAGEISILCDHDGAALTVRVSDTGIGMSKAAQDRLFTKFTQADASTTRRFGGTGLGLAICKQVIELMHGQLTCESEEGRGSILSFSIPLSRVSGAAQVQTFVAHPQAVCSVEGDFRILAAEDNAVNQLVLTTLLTQIGLTPVVVANGQEAIEAWEHRDWDLILMDVQMPIMDGPSASRAIRLREADTGRPRTPIIALTANAMSNHVAEYLAAGMDGHVAKPIQMGELAAAIVQAINASSSEGEATNRGLEQTA